MSHSYIKKNLIFLLSHALYFSHALIFFFFFFSFSPAACILFSFRGCLSKHVSFSLINFFFFFFLKKKKNLHSAFYICFDYFYSYSYCKLTKEESLILDGKVIIRACQLLRGLDPQQRAHCYQKAVIYEY